MSELTTASLPFKPQRIALINPTKFLGNLLLAGGLIQQYCTWCKARDIRLLIVLDERFRGLFSAAFPDADLVFYPRSLLETDAHWQALGAYWRCVSAIRAFKADLAFFIEEDSVSHRLTHFSGARFRVSTSAARYRFGFHAVMPVDRVKSGHVERHIWYSYREAFAAAGMIAEGPPQYAALNSSGMVSDLQLRLQQDGVDFSRPLAVLHTGATKAYKRWPVEHFIGLAQGLTAQGFQVLLIGAGAGDAAINTKIADLCPVVDLCNRLSLPELAELLQKATVMVANDSGPFHLGAALQVPGVVIFGPTDVELWRPLSLRSVVLENKQLCDPACTRTRCLRGYRCMKSVLPEQVLCIIREWKKHPEPC